jgi:hypothetical protein
MADASLPASRLTSFGQMRDNTPRCDYSDAQLRPGLTMPVTRTLTAIAVIIGTAAISLALVTVAAAQSASASDNSVAPSFTGGCTATATIAGYGAIDPSASGGVYTVPKSGEAAYSGSVPVQGEDRTNNGNVKILLPLGLPGITVKSWSSDKADGNSDSGTVRWDIPSIVPGNVEMTVSGFHQDEGVRCAGRIKIKLDGAGLASPVGVASIVLTIASLAGLIWASTPKPGGIQP